eukprot:jgi/Psemu1/15717/gm1.15717_g
MVVVGKSAGVPTNNSMSVTLDFPCLSDDDEPVDKMADIRKGCVPTCPKPLANYEACKERIKNKPGATCEIWYYELHHCVDKCVAPKIFSATKE